ncbi:hypothetical protein LG634_01255 [Streptomyces bambusae]|uniref:hypothetical protein n=1 Tax=Streptomyces bambusae TaxID=1550616 RepID=UPI001CFE74EE|nr:hypothetical protein [Streptomyces bambusae]MCB5163479.1 hypothetical protein [Streptomyces bambusae]
MRVTRRTLRTAAVSAGALSVLAFPVGSAFAVSPEVPEPQVLPGVEQPAHPDGKKDETKEDKQEDKRGETKDETAGKPVLRAFVTTVKLADGSYAKVYSVGKGQYEAEIWSGGTKLDTLVTKGGRAAHGQHNGLHVVLQPDGTVTSWIEGATKPTHKPQRPTKPQPEKDERAHVSSKRITMPDGRIAKLVKGAPGGPRVEFSMPNGNRLGSIDLKKPSTVNDGWTYKLVQDGKRTKFVVIDGKGGGSSWVYDFDGNLIEKHAAERRGRHHKGHQGHQGHQEAGQRVVPKGGVKAGAEGVREGTDGDGPVLLAAGGGMAAAGAAGLGFSMLRRGRTS